MGMQYKCLSYSYSYIVPCTNRRFGDRAFSVTAAKAWNSLPTDLKSATCSTDAFERRLKTWLFKRAHDYQPDYYYYNYFINVCIIIIIVFIIVIAIITI